MCCGCSGANVRSSNPLKPGYPFGALKPSTIRPLKIFIGSCRGTRRSSVLGVRGSMEPAEGRPPKHLPACLVTIVFQMGSKSDVF
jgi:hypothetical protein